MQKKGTELICNKLGGGVGNEQGKNPLHFDVGLVKGAQPGTFYLVLPGFYLVSLSLFVVYTKK